MGNLGANFYSVIQSDNRNKLVKFVNNHIKHGWYPLGGVSHNKDTFYQAMINVLEIEHIKLKKDK